jgi:hypothetical protein
MWDLALPTLLTIIIYQLVSADAATRNKNSNVFQFPGYVRDSVVVAVVLHTNRIKIPKKSISFLSNSAYLFVQQLS